METVWKIRYEGCPTNPRFAVNKRRTAKVITTEQGAREYAESLSKGQYVRILSINEETFGNQQPRCMQMKGEKEE
jgi:hypothetical protein